MQDFSEQSAYLALIPEVLLSVRYLSPPQKVATGYFRQRW